MSTKPAPLIFILTASKRASRLVNSHWVPDEDGFARRWPNGLTPDIGVQRSTRAGSLIETAHRLNDAQLRSGFLDWLYAVDVDAPIHSECDKSCPTWKDAS